MNHLDFLTDVYRCSKSWELTDEELDYLAKVINTNNRQEWVDSAIQFSLALKPKLDNMKNLDLLGAFIKVKF